MQSSVRPKQDSRGTNPDAKLHVGIIMDGNGRWARGKGRPVSFGHRAGVRAIKRVLEGCEELGVTVAGQPFPHLLFEFVLSSDERYRRRNG